MPEHLFPDFLNDPLEYRLAERAWQEEWRRIVRSSGQAGRWKVPWITTSFADGTPFMDGNPIFSAIRPDPRPDRRLGVRVIQLDPAEAPEEFTYWSDTFAEGELEEVKELVICCVLTREHLLDAADLISRWVNRGEAEDERPNRHRPTPIPWRLDKAPAPELVPA
jgi:hypothetical protein